MTALSEQLPLPDFVHGEVEGLANEPFRVDDEQKAAWAGSRILAARRRIARRAHLADQYQTRILEWKTAANLPDERSVEYLLAALQPWLETVIAQDKRSRSVRLPGVKIGLRKRPDRVEISDPSVVVDFCEQHALDGVLVIRKEVQKVELKRHLIEGARIPGAELVLGADELVVSED